MACQRCKKLGDVIVSALSVLQAAAAVEGRGARQPADYPTPHGRLIAAAAEASGLELADLSKRIGHAADYVPRICRGDLKLLKATALTLGPLLGLDLTGYSVRSTRKRQVPGAAQGVGPPELPLPGPCAVEVARGGLAVPEGHVEVAAAGLGTGR
jgi:ribosome-binding protein aMBF1 (putative translation factor)